MIQIRQSTLVIIVGVSVAAKPSLMKSRIRRFRCNCIKKEETKGLQRAKDKIYSCMKSISECDTTSYTTCYYNFTNFNFTVVALTIKP